MDKCPECKADMVHAEGIGEICSNGACPVCDDANLWDGKGNRSDSPIIRGNSLTDSGCSRAAIIEECAAYLDAEADRMENAWLEFINSGKAGPATSFHTIPRGYAKAIRELA